MINIYFHTGAACIRMKIKIIFIVWKKSKSAEFCAFCWFFIVSLANQWVSKIHMWAFDQNLHQHPGGKSIDGNSVWNIQGYAPTGASGPHNSFCLAIPMWQSKWISMTILFLKRLRAAHFYWWISIRTWQKVLWNWLRPPAASSTWPSGICVSSVYECGHRKSPDQP